MTDDRWPVQPLLDLPGVTTTRVCDALHFNGHRWQTAVDHGFTDRQADNAAIRLGYHPAVVWADWVDAGLRELDRMFLDGGWRQAWLWTEQQTLPLELPGPEVAA